jgi:hypothetical protein
MIIRPSDVHPDPEKARLGTMLAARELDIVADLRLTSMWRVEIDGNELITFLELAKELAV